MTAATISLRGQAIACASIERKGNRVVIEGADTPLGFAGDIVKVPALGVAAKITSARYIVSKAGKSEGTRIRAEVVGGLDYQRPIAWHQNEGLHFAHRGRLELHVERDHATGNWQAQLRIGSPQGITRRLAVSRPNKTLAGAKRAAARSLNKAIAGMDAAQRKYARID